MNIDCLDPQLKNNAPLMEVIKAFEDSWSLFKTHLLDEEKRKQLIEFCSYITKLQSTYPIFKEHVESSDA